MENLSTPQPTTNKPVDNLVLPTVSQQLKYPLDYVTQEILRDFVRTIQVQAFPVGSIFISTVATNPAETLGYGTWTAFGAGRTLVGFDSGQTEFDTVEETGGAKTHTLTEAELPAHTFNTMGSSSGAWGITAGSSYGQVTGTATPFSVLNPYIVTYFYKRTA